MINADVNLINFDYENAEIIEEIKRNIETLFSTPEGSCPGDRSFGLNQEFVGMPGPVAQNQLALEIIEKVSIYEPRVEVKDFSFSYEEDGSNKAFVCIAPNRTYEE